jgi:hypothetical protein
MTTATATAATIQNCACTLTARGWRKSEFTWRRA